MHLQRASKVEAKRTETHKEAHPPHLLPPTFLFFSQPNLQPNLPNISAFHHPIALQLQLLHCTYTSTFHPALLFSQSTKQTVRTQFDKLPFLFARNFAAITVAPAVASQTLPAFLIHPQRNGLQMICIQTACVNPQPDTMAGYSPQNRTRTTAAARYILFLCHCIVLCLFLLRLLEFETHVLSDSMFRFFCIATSQHLWPPLRTAGLHQDSQFPRMGPERISSRVPVTSFPELTSRMIM